MGDTSAHDLDELTGHFHDKTKDSDEVRVIDIPGRTVAAIGARGSYSESNFEEARAKLLKSLMNRRNLRSDPVAELPKGGNRFF